MNVTVIVPTSLKAAVEGRKQLQLGMPASASIGDMVETLFRLYPKLTEHIQSDDIETVGQLSFFLSEPIAREWTGGRKGSRRESIRLFVFASVPKRQSTAQQVTS